MVTISIRQDRIEMRGHACRKDDDRIDRACTAISTLTCNLINSMNDLTNDKVESEAQSGLAMIKWKELSAKGKLLVDSWFLGISDINQEYNCIRFI